MKSERIQRILAGDGFLCAGIFLAVVVAYGPALGAGFIWNDADYVTKPGLQSWHGLMRIWTELGATEQYYPILHSAFWCEHRLWGEAALGYHLVNVGLHGLAACLFGLGLRQCAPNRFWPWWGAALFALHPVCVESVAWISEQKNTLSTVFYLAAASVYLRWQRPESDRSRSLYLLATGLFVCAILSKSVTASLPAALLLVRWWQRGRLNIIKDVLPLAPWLAAGVAMGLFSAWVERTYIGAEGTHFALSFGARLGLAGHAAWFYASKLIWPIHLIFIYPRWPTEPVPAAAWLYGVALAGTLAGLVAWARRDRAPLAAALFFLGSLFPTLGFFNVYAFVFSYVADHWQYLASLGLIALFAGGWAKVFRSGAVAAALGLLLILGTLTWRQCRMYRDVETLYRVTLERNPGSWLAHSNLGTLLDAAGRVPEAVTEFRAALQISPEYPEIHTNLADALVRLQRPAEALPEYEAALRLSPGYAPAQVNFANTLVRLGREGEATVHYQAALRLQPGNADWELGLGSSLAKAGRPAEAISHDLAALQLRPGFPEAEYELGNVLANTGRMNDAIEHYQRAVRLRPGYPEARANLGLALTTAGRLQEGLRELDAALQLRPAYAEARAYRGLTLAALGQLPAAAAEYRAALRLAPGAADIHYQLAVVLRRLGRLGEAAEEFAAAEHPEKTGTP